MIDLHVHSSFSDGSLTPEELVSLAQDSGVSVLSLTDHDTTDGLARFSAEGGKMIEARMLMARIPRMT